MAKIFSVGINVARCNPFGLVLVGIALIIVLFAGHLAKLFAPEKKDSAKTMIKLAGLLICAGGVMIAILG